MPISAALAAPASNRLIMFRYLLNLSLAEQRRKVGRVQKLS
jgi:hypothetical protein